MVPDGEALILGLPEPIAVVCHDAGAANTILAWLAREAVEVRPVMRGPAGRLWQERFPAKAIVDDLEGALDGAASLLSGTGWASDVEHRARALARGAGIPSVAVIDHWVNYAERFVRDGERVLPDSIWVTDEEALQIARLTFPNVPILLKPNLYLEEQVDRAGTAPSQGDVLFVAEPARSDWGRGIPGEFQALDYFIANRALVAIPSATRIRLRPHPSDEPGKYDDWLVRHPEMALDSSVDLSDAMIAAEWVVGCQSFALVVALSAGRKTISVLPPWAPACALPHKGIAHLRDAVHPRPA